MNKKMFISLILGWTLSINAQAGWWDSFKDLFRDKNKVDVFEPEYIQFPTVNVNSPYAYKIKKAAWSDQDEKNYEEFVAHLGEAIERGQCHTYENCMKSPANPYFNTYPNDFRFFSDCADLPYMLRGYFAFKNNLPFAFQVTVTPRNVPGNGVSDIRYNPHGNYVVSRATLVAKNSNAFPNATSLFSDYLTTRIGTASFRTSDISTNPRNALTTDLYPVEISRRAVRAGSPMYDPSGHVAVVYKVTSDGRIFYIDSHPDNSITHGQYSSKFMRSSEGLSAGFKNWRPIELVNYSKDASGNLIGGTIVHRPNESLPFYSLVQFYGTESNYSKLPSAALYKVNDRIVNYYEYVRTQMAGGDLKINPVEEVKNLVNDICESVKDRVQAVDVAVVAGIDKRGHPDSLPSNIYGTDGDWETYSSPSRDARLKVMYADALVQVKDLVYKANMSNPIIEYDGNNLIQDMIDSYESTAAQCQITYKNSFWREVSLSYEDVRKRLYLLSFDPYHCVERRWGATDYNELNSCREDSDKKYWYTQEQYLRNQSERRYDVQMAYSASELTPIKPGVGTNVQADTDILSYLNSQKY